MKRNAWGLNVGPNYWSVQDTSGVHICSGTGGGMQFADQMVADARLICAAPVLQEALARLLDCSTRMVGHQRAWPTEAELLAAEQAAAQALDLARGVTA